MSNQDGHRAELRQASVLNERWPGDAVDWRLHRTLNERCLELMVRLARSDEEYAPPAVSSNRKLWSDLDTTACSRAAGCKLLLFDVNFADPAWWLGAIENQPCAQSARTRSYLQPEIASELMRETMTLAWIVARADQRQAILFFGMAPAVASLFSTFSPSDLQRHSARYHRHLRLRFDDRPAYWRMHLRVSTRTRVSDAPALREDRPQSLL